MLARALASTRSLSRLGLTGLMLFLGCSLGQHDMNQVDQAIELTRQISQADLSAYKPS